jgi:predicted transcriptional regulator
MLESLFGNKSAEKVMLALYSQGELHASAIAKNYNTAVDPIKKQLEKFENSGFLISRLVGRSKLYRFNEKNPMINPLKDLLQIADQKKIKSLKINIKRKI